MWKWLFVLVLAVVIFGGSYWFVHEIILKPEREYQQELRGELPPQPTPDVGGPEFAAAMKLKEEGKVVEARAAFESFLDRYPTVARTAQAKDALGEINMQILFSNMPSPEKTEYVVKSGDVLARVANRHKTTPELIMRMNNMSGIMLRIGQRLLISQPKFSLEIDRSEKTVTLLNNSRFFKRYRIHEMKEPPKKQTRVQTTVADVIAWRDGKRVGFADKGYANTARWIRIAPVIYLYAIDDDTAPEAGVPAPGVGYGMSGADLVELSALVNRRTPVTISD